MYIQQLVIRNFRVFGNDGVMFLFDKGVNVVIGENNNGKSALIDAIRIAFSSALYKKDIYFSRSDFHVDASGCKATTAQIDVYLGDVPKNLIEIWNPMKADCGEFHVAFSLEKTPSGYEKIKCKTWGGQCEGNPLSQDTLEAINLAYLGALRDAENEMKPARNSKLASLLETIATDPEEKDKLVDKLRKANQEILQTESLGKTKQIVNENLLHIEQGLLHQQIDLGLVEPKFESIMSSLCSWLVPRWYFIRKDHASYAEIVRLFNEDELRSFIQPQEDGSFVDVDGYLAKSPGIAQGEKEALLSLKNYSFQLHQNGLGYNNLLFISAVLGDMSLSKNGIYSNVFLVEEPEAHLHPQLQELVLNFFSKKVEESEHIQVIMTSHSPTLVSKIGIEHINLLYENRHRIFNYPFAQANLSNEERGYLEKYLDVTKSQLFFAKGVLFVEGISEAILMPEFAKLINRPLDMYAVEVVNINGVGFAPFAKLLKIPNQQRGFAKAAIITDDDRCTNKKEPTYISKDLDYDDELDGILEKIEKGTPSDRYVKIAGLCADGIVSCFGAKKTFEYELCLEESNISYVLTAISQVYPDVGEELKANVASQNSVEAKALRIWLFIRSRNAAKAQVAQALSELLKKQTKKVKMGEAIDAPFVVPKYIHDAICNVTRNMDVSKE